MAAPQRRWAAELLHFWFHKLGPRVWFAPDPRADDLLRRRFGRELARLAVRPVHEFLDDPPTALAAVLLFDQLPRNFYRQDPRRFAFDPLARAISKAALDRGLDRVLSQVQRQFLAMPLMHSEAIADQTGAPVAADADDAEENVTFDRMTEEDLLAGIEGLVPPEKSDDY